MEHGEKVERGERENMWYREGYGENDEHPMNAGLIQTQKCCFT